MDTPVRFARRSVLRVAANWMVVLAVATTALPSRALAQFTPFESVLARFDAEVATGVAEDGGGAVSIAVFKGDQIIRGAASGSIYGWEQKVLESIPHTAYQTAPLTEYSYSNIGFGMLGLALSRAAGAPFMDLVETLIFRPLGLESSTFILDSPELLSRMSVGYARNRRTGEISAEQATREHFGRGYKVPNGGVYSTVHDMAAFAAAMMGEGPVQILGEESRRVMFTPQVPADNYGQGFTTRVTDTGAILVGHGGSVAGYNANLAFDLDSKLGVAMLRTASFNPSVNRLLQELIIAGR